MIDAKSFMEFFEKQFNIQFIDVETGMKALDVVAEHEKKNAPYGSPEYKSDYDRFIEENGDR